MSLSRDLSVKPTTYSVSAHDPQTTRCTIIEMGNRTGALLPGNHSLPREYPYRCYSETITGAVRLI